MSDPRRWDATSWMSDALPHLAFGLVSWVALAGQAAGVDSPFMKKVLELLVCLIHPLAVILMWINLASRNDLSAGSKLAWAIFGLIPLVPFLYVLTGGDLW